MSILGSFFNNFCSEKMKKNKSISLFVVLIIISGFAVYGNALDGKFIFDDEWLIRDNIYIKSWSDVQKIFEEDIGAGGGHTFNFYRPLQMLTYMIDYSLWGLNPRGYHLSNSVFHILAALGIFWLITILYGDSVLSFLTGVLFVVHPVHTEAVSYISGRSDSLAALCMLLAFIFYIKNLNSQSIHTFFFMTVSYIAALLSKEISLIFPVLILLYHSVFERRLDIKKFMPIVSIASLYIIVRVTLLKSLLPDVFSYPTTLLQRLPGFFAAIAHYTRLMLLPFGLHMEYGQTIFTFGDLGVMVGITISLLLLLYVIKKRKTHGVLFFSLSWFFITILPVSNLYPLNAYMAEHWLYLPSIGLFLIAAEGIMCLYRTPPLKRYAVISIIGLVVFCASLTIKQNNYWKEPIVFYERTLHYAPDSPRACNNLGREYDARGKKREAIALYKKAIKLFPGYADAYNNLGAAYATLGKRDEALPMLEKALAINPHHAVAHYNLAGCYYETRQYDLAIAHYDKAIELGCNAPELSKLLEPYRSHLKATEKSQ